MKSAVFLATFSLILFKKIINGQQLVYNENFDTNGLISQQPPTHTMVNSANFNENNAPLSNCVNQHQILIRPNTPVPLSSSLQIQQPPDLQQQPLQVQQYLQLQQPLSFESQIELQSSSQPQQPLQLQTQPILQSQQPLQSQPQMQTQPLLTQELLPLQVPLQTYPAIQHQDILPPQQNVQFQHALETPQFKQSLRYSHPIQLSQQNIEPLEPAQMRQHSQSQQFSLGPQSLQQQPLGFLQNSPLSLSENKKFVETSDIQQSNKNQHDSQTHVNWQLSNPQSVLYSENLHNRSPATVMDNSQKCNDKSHEASLLPYYIAPQLPPSSSAPSVISPMDFNSHPVPIMPPYNVKVPEDIYISIISPNSCIKSVSEIPSPILPVQSPSIPNNMQTYYFNQQSIDHNQNGYINQNSGQHYPLPSQLPVTVIQSLPKAVIPSQSAIVSPVPVSIVQAPSIPPQYVVSSGYPVNTIVAPAYISQKSKSPNLKALLPLIFNLLRERLTEGGCRNECPCNCGDKDLEVLSGYSSQKHYGSPNNDKLSIFNIESDDVEGTKNLRDRKNCERIQKIPPETSNETEEEDSDEEVEEDED